MVNNEWDDILYWENYEPYQKMIQMILFSMIVGVGNVMSIIGRQFQTKKSLSDVFSTMNTMENHIGLRDIIEQ